MTSNKTHQDYLVYLEDAISYYKKQLEEAKAVRDIYLKWKSPEKNINEKVKTHTPKLNSACYVYTPAIEMIGIHAIIFQALYEKDSGLSIKDLSAETNLTKTCIKKIYRKYTRDNLCVFADGVITLTEKGKSLAQRANCRNKPIEDNFYESIEGYPNLNTD